MNIDDPRWNYRAEWTKPTTGSKIFINFVLFESSTSIFAKVCVDLRRTIVQQLPSDGVTFQSARCLPVQILPSHIQEIRTLVQLLLQMKRECSTQDMYRVEHSRFICSNSCTNVRISFS